MADWRAALAWVVRPSFAAASPGCLGEVVGKGRRLAALMRGLRGET